MITDSTEEQLEQLRKRFREIRVSKQWLQEYRLNAPITVSKSLAQYHNWLCKQEDKTIQMAKRIKNSK